MTEHPITAAPDDAADNQAPGEHASATEAMARADRAEDQWRRSAADLENLQKRFQREVARERAAEREHVALRWIAMLDDLDRSVAYADHPEHTTAMVDGVKAIVANAVEAIAGLGYPRFGDVGDSFDAALHEVLSTVGADADHPTNTIAAIVKAGYGTRENLLRPASVVVAADAD